MYGKQGGHWHFLCATDTILCLYMLKYGLVSPVDNKLMLLGGRNGKESALYSYC